jgi:Ca2+-binding RTX toxin-like protein
LKTRALVLAALVAGCFVPAGSGAAATTPRCQGEAATLVGAGQQVLRGTPGRDVIVTRGVFEVRAGGGDDLICVTRTAGAETGNVHAGAGADEVWIVDGRRGGFTWTELGPGADTFHGGPGWETVWAGTAPQESESAGPREGRDRDADVISTGGGADQVVLGDPGSALADRVRTGRGPDEVTLQATSMTAGAVLDLGDGGDRITFDWPTEDLGAWVLDNRTGTGTLDGQQRLQWSSTEAFVLPEPGANAVSFVGSDAAESVWASSFDDIDLGGGDDYFAEDLTQVGATRPGTLHGGAGRDSYNLDESSDGAYVDLAAGRVTFAAHAPLVPLALDGVEDVRVQGGWDPVTVRGDGAANRIEVGGCGATVRGGGGDDRILATGMTRCRAGSRAVLAGGPGRDVLVGGETPDRLSGGAGRDRADGRAGDDTCTAEVRISCRRPS